MDATQDLLTAVKRFIQASDLCEERVARRLGLGRTDLRAINLLEDGPISQSEIAQRLGLSRASITVLIDRLVARGFVQRTPHATDRRVSQIELLPAAWQALAQIYRPIGMAVMASVDELPTASKQRLARQLDVMAATFDAQVRDGD